MAADQEPVGCSQHGDDGPVTSSFFTGYARLPEGITASEMYGLVGIALEVEDDTGMIVAADCTLATGLGRDFFSRLVVGFRLDEDFECMVSQVRSRYHGSAQKAVLTALRITRDKYRACRKESAGE